MSDCDVAAMDVYMSGEWEPDHIHLRLKAESEEKDKTIADLQAENREFIRKVIWLESRLVPEYYKEYIELRKEIEEIEAALKEEAE